MCVQNKREGAFSLFSYFCNMKKTGGYVLVYSATFLIQKICVQKEGGAAFWFIKLLLQYKKCVFKNAGAAF